MQNFAVRKFGDPVLKVMTSDVVEFTGELQKLAESMVPTLYASNGLGLAATQVGIQKRLFVYDMDDDEGPQSVVNPVIVEEDGTAVYEEGCLSIPGLFWAIERADTITVQMRDTDGKEKVLELEGLMARLFQHELDHLNGVLMFDRIVDPDERKKALSEYNNILITGEIPVGKHTKRL